MEARVFSTPQSHKIVDCVTIDGPNESKIGLYEISRHTEIRQTYADIYML